MDKKELLETRKIVYEQYKLRTELGEFDANSNAIQLCLKTLVELINHAIEEARKQDNVHRKTGTKTDQVSTR